MSDSLEEVSRPLNQFDTKKRSHFGIIGCDVFGWPSSGGVLIKEVDIVELMFLGLDRFQPSLRSSNVVEEDQFCNRLRMLGAKWWESEEDYIHVLLGMRQKTAVESSELVFGWPSAGGVWVLRFESEKEIPRDFGKLHMALDMDERCRVMELYGGVYHTDPNEVRDLAGLL